MQRLDGLHQLWHSHLTRAAEGSDSKLHQEPNTIIASSDSLKVLMELTVTGIAISSLLAAELTHLISKEQFYASFIVTLLEFALLPIPMLIITACR
jgi:hypothetical protein